jgi:hypothetical protein
MTAHAPRPTAKNVRPGEPIAREVAGLRLSRFEIRELDLEPGTTLMLELRSGEVAHALAPIVGDDPKPPHAPTISFPASLPQQREQDGFVVLQVVKGPATALDAAIITAVYAEKRWSEYLPAVFRRDPEQAEFLSRYLNALFVEGERIEARLDGLVDHVVPCRLPSVAAARFLAGWFDIDLLAVRDLGATEEVTMLQSLDAARAFLASVLPCALTSGTVEAFLVWVDAIARARGMSDDRRCAIAVVEGFKMRRLFTLPRDPRPNDPEPTALQRDWGRLPDSAPLAGDPLASRAYLDEGRLLDHVTLGLPGEDEDPTLLARLLGGRLFLFVAEPLEHEPTLAQWPRLLAPVLPAHLKLDVRTLPCSSELGFDAVLGLSTRLRT